MSALPNLVDALSNGGPRAFCVPIASDVFARSQQFPPVPEALFSPSDDAVDGMPCFTVSITDLLDQLHDQQGLPHEALRLHAVGRGKVTYRPVLGTLQKCLVLTLAPVWPRAAQRAKWLERWLEAGQVPRTFIYENVDDVHLRQMLQSLSPDPSPADPSQPRGVGITMPSRVLRDGSSAVATSKTEFIDDFMNGAAGAALIVQPGACIGKIGAALTQQTYRVRFHVRYEGSTDADPRPMHPRELFHLLFGNDSPEALNNALLKSIHSAGQRDSALPKTRRMLLRPPLRTHFRVMWEAQQEFATPEAADGHEARWAATGTLGQELLTNTVPGFDPRKTYADLYKCNCFVSEMLLRSGYRVRMIRNPAAGAQPETVYYYLANRLAAEARDVIIPPDGPGTLATDGEAAWGRRWDSVLARDNAAQAAADINRMMHEEGRAIYLVQEYRGATMSASHGHVLLLERVEDAFPQGDRLFGQRTVRFEIEGSPLKGTTIGLVYIHASVFEAPQDGLFHRTRTIFTQWPELFTTNPQRASRNNDLLLIEAVPGADPSTDRGIADLCVVHQKAP